MMATFRTSDAIESPTRDVVKCVSPETSVQVAITSWPESRESRQRPHGAELLATRSGRSEAIFRVDGLPVGARPSRSNIPIMVSALSPTFRSKVMPLRAWLVTPCVECPFPIEKDSPQ